MPEITVVIPCRKGSSADVTLRSLARQTLQNFDIVLSTDEEGKGAPWARNRGADLARTPYLLFSDDDINWEPDAVETLYNCLENHVGHASYAYGAYAIGDWIQCNVPFDIAHLQRSNFISTMSLIRREVFPGFDENLKRLMDWDLWLTMLKRGHVGVYCGKLVFRTEKGNGITYGPDALPYEEAKAIVKAKHKLI